jgi:hypothetical protein
MQRLIISHRLQLIFYIEVTVYRCIISMHLRLRIQNQNTSFSSGSGYKIKINLAPPAPDTKSKYLWLLRLRIQNQNTSGSSGSGYKINTPMAPPAPGQAPTLTVRNMTKKFVGANSEVSIKNYISSSL